MIDHLAIYRWTYANKRSRREYARYPTACATWCPQCVNPVEKARCERCKDTMRKRRLKEKS